MTTAILGSGEASARLKLDRAFGNIQSVDGKDKDGRVVYDGLHRRTRALFGSLITEEIAGRIEPTGRVDMNMTISTGQTRAPTVPYGGVVPKRESSYPPPPVEAPMQAKKGDVAERQAQRVTAWKADERALGWTLDTSRSGRETKTTRKILDAIDADTLRKARVKEGTKPQIEVNRDRIAALLGLREEWKRPDEVYADEAWEICIVWRSGYGRVEIGTEKDGSIGYYVSRALSDESGEGSFQEHSMEELGRIMSWLDEEPEEI